MKNRSILIVEDDEAIASLLLEILSGEGYEVNWAKNGAVALERLHNYQIPHVILLDLMMPVMNGYEFRAMQEHDQELSKIPTVVMTAGIERPESDSRLKNIASYFKKPIDLTPLLESIHRLAM